MRKLLILTVLLTGAALATVDVIPYFGKVIISAGTVTDTFGRGLWFLGRATWAKSGESLAIDSNAVRLWGNNYWLTLLGKAADASGADSADVGVVSRSCTGNAATADSSKGGAARATLATGSSLLQGKDTTALWNAKTLQGKDTSYFLKATGTGSDSSGNHLVLQATRFRGALTGNVTGTASNATKADSALIAASAYKKIPRTCDTASTATPTPNCDLIDQYDLTALAVGATFAIPAGTPINGQKLIIRILDNGTAQALSWNSGAGGYASRGATLPTTTVLGKYMYVGLIYNSVASRWDCIAVVTEA